MHINYIELSYHFFPTNLTISWNTIQFTESTIQYLNNKRYYWRSVWKVKKAEREHPNLSKNNTKQNKAHNTFKPNQTKLDTEKHQSAVMGNEMICLCSLWHFKSMFLFKFNSSTILQTFFDTSILKGHWTIFWHFLFDWLLFIM